MLPPRLSDGWLHLQGRAYYPFTADTHCARLQYDPAKALSLCFDFNVSPGIAVICQEQRLPNGLSGTGVIGEVCIPRNSNTPAVCAKIVADWGSHRGPVHAYGDATGGASGSAKVAGSDWELIDRAMREVFGARYVNRVPRSNPRERERVNAMNTRLMNGDGQIHLMIDAAKAPNTVRDLEGVRVLDGGSGEIDKRHDARLTHLSDALGYHVHYHWPIAGRGVTTFGLTL